MNEMFRLRFSSSALRVFLCCSLLPLSSTLFAADYPHTSMHRHVRKTHPQTRSTSATAVLFEQNDAARAYKLAQRDLSRSPHNVNAWFLSMEAANLRLDQSAELRSALSVCAFAKKDDPRSTIAAMRLGAMGQNSAAFRQRRSAIERVASQESACSGAAREALYEASLDGLAQSDARELARESGWLTTWTIGRNSTASTKSQPEQFEFIDGRIRLPEYLAPSASYTAESVYEAPETATYAIAGEHKGLKIAIDGREVLEPEVVLSEGKHTVRFSFRGSDLAPRIRIVRSAATGDEDATRGVRSRREQEYIRAAVELALGRRDDAAEEIRNSELATTAIGVRLLADAEPDISEPRTSTPLPVNVVLSHPTCGNLTAAIDLPSNRDSEATMEAQLLSCAPDSLAYALWLASKERHLDAISELNRVLQQWPLDRQAHRLLISELQRSGNNQAADRAAAELMAIAPNARNFRRMAQNASALHNENAAAPFFEAYRRMTPAALPETSNPGTPIVILLQDKVAISRTDGSISMYMHRVVQLMTDAGARSYRALPIPSGAQLLTSRIVNRVAAAAQPLGAPSALRTGDEIEEEYVVNFTGDGGMISHPEAFQYVFNDFDSPLLDARFIVLSPARETPGYVIVSGAVPASHTEFADGYRAETWERKIESADVVDPTSGIVRVVENENGWSVPPSVERRRILETIHPGPRPREA
jgi:hypothetical protein